MHFPSAALIVLLATTSLGEGPAGSDITKLPNIAYKSGDALSAYEKERCKLDVYLPATGKDFATLVWFHGGGLTGGNKDSVDKMARSLAGAGLAVVVPNYRLSPRAKYPAYIEDAAAAVAWTKAHLAEHGGDVKRLFVSGHSAGGYLTLMIGMDGPYLHGAGVEAESRGFDPGEWPDDDTLHRTR